MWNIQKAGLGDISLWMDLVHKVRWNFPGLDTEAGINEYQSVLSKNINRGSAICVKVDNRIVGVLLYSINQKRLSFMAVDPEYRRQGIGESLVNTMFMEFKNGDEIQVSTFMGNDEKGIAPRALYKKLGFIESELCIEHNYPNQMFRKVLE